MSSLATIPDRIFAKLDTASSVPDVTWDQFVPADGHLLIEECPPEDFARKGSRIVLPEKAKADRWTGWVRKVALDVREYKTGDLVMYKHGAGFPIEIADKPYVVQDCRDMLGKFDGAVENLPPAASPEQTSPPQASKKVLDMPAAGP